MLATNATLAAEVPGSTEYRLLVSDSPDLVNSTELAERYILSGEVFVYVSETSAIDQVRFYLDHPQELLEDPIVAGTPHHVASSAPFEFSNAVAPDGSGEFRGFDTERVEDGAHVLTAAIDLANGQVVVLHTPLVVHNGLPSLIFNPGQLAFKLHAGETVVREVNVLTSDHATTDLALTSDVPWATSDASPTTLAPDTAMVAISAGGLAPGSYTARLTASSSTHASASMEIRLSVVSSGASATSNISGENSRALQQCAPLDCSEILVELPYVLDFSQDHGKITDGSGAGTGFTYIDQPSNGTGYMPQNLDLDASSPGTLDISTTNGIMSGASNSQDNALAVGIDAPSQISLLSTTLISPPTGSGNYEQAGLWFGNDENNYVKFEVISTPSATRIEFLMEVNGSSAYSQVSSALNLAGAAITLNLTVDPNDRTISGMYKINGGLSTSLGDTVAPPEFFSFDAAGIDPTIGTRSFGGLYATHRNGSTPLTYTFDDFSVTAQAAPPPSTDVEFERVSFPVPTPTSLAWGPDNRLYVTELFGTIHAITLDADQNVLDDQEITTLGSRLTLGIAVDPLSTPENVILWVAHSNASVNSGALNSSTVSRLSGPGFSIKDDVITGLPRAIANHAINSIHFGPDGKLYIALGGNTGAGAPNTANTEFGTRAEQPLSAALLVANVRAANFDGSCATPEGSYGPAPCDVQVYASGLRNSYDFVWHSNGSLYAPDNGLGVTGTFPPSASAPCEGFGSTSSWTTGGENPGEQPDILNRIQPGKYYGHPNPYRNECVYKDGSYQGVAAPANYEPPILDLGGHRSSNGIVEYTSNAFEGSLQGQLLITNYSVGDDIRRVHLSPDGQTILEYEQLVGGFNDPLPLLEGPGGVLYVGEFGSNEVTALIPAGGVSLPVGNWVDKQTGPASLLDVGGAALDGKLYAVGGKTTAGPQRNVYIYDPALDSWSEGPSLPLEYPAVENPAIVSYNSKLYAFGGSTSPFSGATTSAAVFDPSTGEWTMLPPMASGRSGAAAQAVGSLIYVAGGMGGNGASLATVEVFDPTTNTWGTAPPMQTPRDNPGSAVLNGDFYVFGGRTRDASGNEINGTLTSVEMFDPDTQAWSARAAMPTGRRVPVVGTLNGRAQVMGGERTPSGSTFPQNEEYDPLTNTWRTLEPMSPGRHGAAAATIGSAVYVAFGGIVAGSSFSNTLEAFSFSTSSDTTPPAAPQNLTANLQADDVTIALDWSDNSEPDLAGYRVFRGTQQGGPYALLTTIGATSSYDDTSAPAGVTVYYRVSAIDTGNNQSAQSNEATETRPPDTTPPAAPAGLSATGTVAGINLDWDDNTETDLLGYRIYRADQPGGPYTMLTEIGATSAYTDTSATAEVAYYFQVTALDTSGNESDPSSEVSGTRLLDTEPPAPPAGLTANGTFTGIDLDWNNNTETDLAGYRIYRSEQSGGPYTLLAEVGTTPSFSDETLAINQIAYYQVTAFDTTNNESAPSAEAGSSRLDPDYNLLVSTSSNRSNPIALNGQTVSSDIFIFTGPNTPNILRVRFYLDDPAITGTPFRTENSAPYDFNGGQSSSAVPFNTTTLSNGTHTITAAIELTDGATDTTEATFTVANDVPEPTVHPVPGTIQVEDYDVGGEGVGYHDTTVGNTGGQYRSDSVDIQTTSDAGGGFNVGWIRTGEWLRYTVDVAETGTYDVTFRTATQFSNRRLHLEVEGTDISGPVVAPNTGGTQNWTNVTATVLLSAGIQQLIVVMDDDNFNLNYFSIAPSQAPPPDTEPPAAPVGLAATGTLAGIDLDWANNSESDLAGYRVYRSSQAGGPYTLLAELGATSAYSDTSIAAGETAYYQVTALDTSDNESAPSNEVSGTRQQIIYELLMSVSADRSNPVPLDGQTVANNIYVFASPVTATISQVRFFLDDPTMQGSPRHIEGSPPYDFAGGSSSSASALNTKTLTNGSHTITAEIVFSNASTTVIHANFTVENAIPPPVTTPLPGIVQAEDYDAGGQNVGYFDTTPGNSGGSYRTDSVDIQSTTDSGGGFNVGWIRTGEWLRYTVDIASADDYTVTFRVATPHSGRRLHLELDGVDISGPVAIPVTGGTQFWRNVSVNVPLPAGVHQLKVVMDTDSFNLNYFTVALAAQ